MSVKLLRVLEGGRAPRGWEELWRRDQWRARELPHGDLASANAGRAILHFEGLVQPWLREAAKRWARARLLAAMAPSTISDNLLHLRAFSLDCRRRWAFGLSGRRWLPGGGGRLVGWWLPGPVGLGRFDLVNDARL
jgi:hypothetical protein